MNGRERGEKTRRASHRGSEPAGRVTVDGQPDISPECPPATVNAEAKNLWRQYAEIISRPNGSWYVHHAGSTIFGKLEVRPEVVLVVPELLAHPSPLKALATFVPWDILAMASRHGCSHPMNRNAAARCRFVTTIRLVRGQPQSGSAWPMAIVAVRELSLKQCLHPVCDQIGPTQPRHHSLDVVASLLSDGHLAGPNQ